MADSSNNSNGQNGSARWAGVVVTVVLAAGAMTIQWGVVTTKLQQVEKRLDEFIGEARSIRAQYAEMERKIWFLEGKLSGLTSNSPRQSVPTTGSPVIGGGP
jgi:hypothetical protein